MKNVKPQKQTEFEPLSVIQSILSREIRKRKVRSSVRRTTERRDEWK